MSRKRTRRRISRWKWARRATALTFIVLMVLGARPWFEWFRGSTTGSRLLEVIPLADPLAAIEVTLASRALHGTMWLGAGILIGACLLLGPVFCGWVCPLGLLLDLNDGLRRRLVRLPGGKRNSRRRERGLRVPRVTRYGVLGLVVGFSAVAGLPVFQIVSPINLVAWTLVFFAAPGGEQSEWPARIAAGAQAAVTAAGPLLWFLAGIVLAEYFLPRLWCRSLCPLGALYSLVGRRAPLRVRVNPREAGKSRCEYCAYDCPMGIEVMRDYTLAGKPSIDDPECTRCGECIDTCPRGVLALSFRDFPPLETPPTHPPQDESALDELHNPLEVIQGHEQR